MKAGLKLAEITAFRVILNSTRLTALLIKLFWHPSAGKSQLIFCFQKE